MPGSDVFGTIKTPQGVAQYNTTAGAAGGNIGLILFASNLLRLFTLVAGIFVLFNFLTAGFSLVAGSGKSDAYSKAMQKITMSIVGIIIMVSAYILAALVGLLVFGDPTYILEPTICGPAGC